MRMRFNLKGVNIEDGLTGLRVLPNTFICIENLIDSKECQSCRERKIVWDYYRHALRPDGLQPYCKECCKENSKRRNVEHHEEILIYKREYNQAHKTEHKDANYKWFAANRNRQKAHHAVSLALSEGRIVRPSTCQACGKSGVKIIAHHDSYLEDQWLNVKWWCESCHKTHHSKLKEDGIEI